jgi:hypothetical protein
MLVKYNQIMRISKEKDFEYEEYFVTVEEVEQWKPRRILMNSFRS